MKLEMAAAAAWSGTRNTARTSPSGRRFPAGGCGAVPAPRLTELSAGSLTMTAAGEEFLPGPREEAN